MAPTWQRCGRMGLPWLAVALAGAATCWGQPAAGETDEPTEIGPPDVLVRVALVRDELELIRFVMGRPTNRRPEIGVQGAAPREVYFQALTMFRKAERLCYEHTRERAEEPELPRGEIHPAHVYDVVNLALERIALVKRELNIEQQSRIRRRQDDKTPSDVFRSIVQANRQLNLLLERQFAPAEVFQQVTVGVAFTARLLETFPDAPAIPAEPPLEAGKTPADVYHRLVGCFDRIRSIADVSDVRILKLTSEDGAAEHIAPSDVYDIASLLVAELAYLHGHLPAAKPPRKVYYAGRKFPAHVYQRAGILERQLIELEKWVKADPHWLKHQPAEQ